MRDYLQSPVDNSWVNFDGHPNGDAMDLGWRQSVGPNQPVHMPADGVVIENEYYSDGGHSLITKHDYNHNFDAWVGMMHFKDKASGKPGEFIKRGTRVATMGSTGKSTGEHVHVRMSLVPKGTSFNWNDFGKYRVNPYDYFFEFPHQDVLDMKKKPSKPFKPTAPEVAEDGIITVKAKEGLRIRKQPSMNSETLSVMAEGTEKVYTHYVDAGGIRWVKLKEGGYAARRDLGGAKRVYADARFIDAPKPAPKPTKIGKWANFKDEVRLFMKSRGDGCYHHQYNGHNNVYTDIRATSAKILDEDNGRVLVSVPRFNPNKVWIANSESTVTDKPLYKL